MLRSSLRFATILTTLVFPVACSSESDEPGSDSLGTGTGTNDIDAVGSGGPSGTAPAPGAPTSTVSGSNAPSDGATGPGSGSTSAPPVTTPGATGATGSTGAPLPGPGATGATGPTGPGSTPADPPGATATGGGEPMGGAGGSGGADDPMTGMGGMNGSPGGTPGMMDGPDVDQNGKANAMPGETTSVAQDYLRLGEIRILNNNWGSEDLGCDAQMSVFVTQDRQFGWNFNRGDCDTGNSNQYPDFPQVEFGIHPFGIGNELVTSPEFSSTTLLPLQIKDIQSSSVTVENLQIQLQQGSSWNITFEFWLSDQHPTTPGNAGVVAELMTFWGWQAGRWPDALDGTGMPTGNGAGVDVESGGKTYKLWVQQDGWASGWNYFQFRDNTGPNSHFSGTVDVKKLLDYLVNDRGYSPDLWVTRLEVGSEIDDNTSGTVQMSNISFEVNGQTRSPVFGGD